MARSEIHVDGLAAAMGRGWSPLTYFDDHGSELTTEHAASSYGMPVLVRGDGKVYGPGDLPGVVLHLSATNDADAELIAPAVAAGWTVKVHAWCDYCGTELSNPATRRPGDEHPDCMRDRLRDSDIQP